MRAISRGLNETCCPEKVHGEAGLEHTQSKATGRDLLLLLMCLLGLQLGVRGNADAERIVPQVLSQDSPGDDMLFQECT